MRTETQTNVIESAFQDYTERKDIAILLINQHVRRIPSCLRDPLLLGASTRLTDRFRSPREYARRWTDTRLLFLLFSRFPAKSTLTVCPPFFTSKLIVRSVNQALIRG